jgi:hypothetical protein
MALDAPDERRRRLDDEPGALRRIAVGYRLR